MGIFLDSILASFARLLESLPSYFSSNRLCTLLPRYLPYSIKAFLWFFIILLFWNFFQKKDSADKDNEAS
ncbi:MAG: hypothetical protein HUU50_07020 [Candidatus Brocadiae bacterium]|nr:hypothetical protein [Candidatus Brocadiia bacterium]